MLHDLTPTQRQIIERSRAFRQSIAARAVPEKPTPERSIGVRGGYVQPPKPTIKPAPQEIRPPSERHWFQIIDEIASETPSVARIQAVVCHYYGIKKSHLISARRICRVIYVRHVAIYITKELTSRTLPDIGRRFGNRDHTTILHAVRKISRLIVKDEILAFEVAQLIELITGVQQ